MTTMTHYKWRVDRNGELVTPVDLHDAPYDHHFLTEKEALRSKCGIAPHDEWTLVRATTEIIQESVFDPKCET